MNKKSWLIVGLSLAMAASIGVGISACGGETHTHNYDAWDYNETQHWKYCDEHGSDKSNIDETTKANHDFKDGKCECGATEGQEIPDADLDTREFWATGAGAGDLQSSSWTELKPNFKLTKEPTKDEDGFTLYTIQFKIYAGGDSFKIRQNEKDENGALKWTDGTYFGIDELRNASGTFIDAGTKNIGVATGKDGIYKFTVHTKPAPAPWKDNFVTWELVESVTPPTTTEDMYIVGKLATYPKNDWPGYGVLENCIHMTFDGDKTWSATITVKEGDQFKVYNKLNQQYYPDQGGNLTRPSDAPDGLFEVTWVSGALKPTLKHVHTYSKWAYDSENHWKACDFDNAKDESTIEAHDFSQGDTCKCGFQQEADPDWKIEGGELVEYTGDYVNLKIPADLTVFPDFGKLFGMGKNNTYESAKCEQANLAKVQSVTVDPKNEHFKVENNAVLSTDGTVLYMYFPCSTETEVTFENVTTINNSAFYYNTTVTSVSFPKAVNVGKYAFYQTTALETVSLPLAEVIGENAFDASGVKTVEFTKVQVIRSSAFANSKVTTADLRTVTTLDKSAFYKSDIESVDLESIRTIGDSVFTYCAKLKTVVFGEKLQTLKGTGTLLAGCTVLTTVTIKTTTVLEADKHLFQLSKAITDIFVPAESVDAYKAADVWKDQADKIKAIPTEAVSAPAEVALPASKKED